MDRTGPSNARYVNTKHTGDLAEAQASFSQERVDDDTDNGTAADIFHLIIGTLGLVDGFFDVEALKTLHLLNRAHYELINSTGKCSRVSASIPLITIVSCRMLSRRLESLTLTLDGLYCPNPRDREACAAAYFPKLSNMTLDSGCMIVALQYASMPSLTSLILKNVGARTMNYSLPVCPEWNLRELHIIGAENEPTQVQVDSFVHILQKFPELRQLSFQRLTLSDNLEFKNNRIENSLPFLEILKLDIAFLRKIFADLKRPQGGCPWPNLTHLDIKLHGSDLDLFARMFKVRKMRVLRLQINDRWYKSFELVNCLTTLAESELEELELWGIQCKTDVLSAIKLPHLRSLKLQGSKINHDVLDLAEMTVPALRDLALNADVGIKAPHLLTKMLPHLRSLEIRSTSPYTKETVETLLVEVMPHLVTCKLALRASEEGFITVLQRLQSPLLHGQVAVWPLLEILSIEFLVKTRNWRPLGKETLALLVGAAGHSPKLRQLHFLVWCDGSMRKWAEEVTALAIQVNAWQELETLHISCYYTEEIFDEGDDDQEVVIPPQNEIQEVFRQAWPKADVTVITSFQN